MTDPERFIRALAPRCRESVAETWCEDNDVYYVFGLARNVRLVKRIRKQLNRAKKRYWRTQEAARYDRDFRYRTLHSWSQARRVAGRAEQLSKGENPRLVVTSLPKEEFDARALYEDLDCARGDMEKRIKEHQLGLFVDRTSSTTFSANQLRLWFSSVAYVLLSELRRAALKGTGLARAQCTTIRTNLLKIGAQVSLGFRRVWIRCATGCPYQRLFVQALENLREHSAPLRI